MVQHQSPPPPQAPVEAGSQVWPDQLGRVGIGIGTQELDKGSQRVPGGQLVALVGATVEAGVTDVGAGVGGSVGLTVAGHSAAVWQNQALSGQSR